MNVLGLVASPRKGGNSEILIKEMLMALPTDIGKEMIRLPALDIRPCKACYACLPKENVCVIEDDLGFLLAKVKAADVVIIATACYFLGPHTSIKIVSDRLLSIEGNREEFVGKKCVTVVSHGLLDEEGYAREAVNNFARFLHLDIVGNMLVRAAIPGEVIRDDVLAEAREMAERLSLPSQNSTIPGVLNCEGCGSSLLQMTPDGQVRCVMCGARGILEVEPERFALKFSSGQIRFSPKGIAEHARTLEEIKQRFMEMRQEITLRRKTYDSYNCWVNPSRNL